MCLYLPTKSKKKDKPIHKINCYGSSASSSSSGSSRHRSRANRPIPGYAAYEKKRDTEFQHMRERTYQGVLTDIENIDQIKKKLAPPSNSHGAQHHERSPVEIAKEAAAAVLKAQGEEEERTRKAREPVEMMRKMIEEQKRERDEQQQQKDREESKTSVLALARRIDEQEREKKQREVYKTLDNMVLERLSNIGSIAPLSPPLNQWGNSDAYGRSLGGWNSNGNANGGGFGGWNGNIGGRYLGGMIAPQRQGLLGDATFDTFTHHDQRLSRLEGKQREMDMDLFVEQQKNNVRISRGLAWP
ncbi:hypothetical protein V8E51_014277 [Hyaloscypha variabilis]